jgi:hypothetical protein
MITTATINLPSGDVIAGRLETSRPNQKEKVAWTGPVDQFSHSLETADSYTLEAFVENQAKLIDSTWEVKRDGDWNVPI